MTFWESTGNAIFRYRTIQQIVALYKKNALVAWRNQRATALRLIAPLFFCLLALVIDKSIQANSSTHDIFADVTTPALQSITSIPSCHDDMYIGAKNDCIELVYSPNTSAVAQTIMQGVLDNNGNAIQARGFASIADSNAFLLNNINYVIGAVHFLFDNTSALEGYTIQTNSTTKYFKGTYQDKTFFVEMPLQSAVQRETSRYVLGQSASTASSAANLQWAVSVSTFAHPTIASTSIIGQVLGPFIFAACMFSFVIQIGSVVMEKEAGLRQAMRTMGMTDTAYWVSWMLWEITLSFFSANLMCCFGLLCQFSIFLNNNYALLLFLFFNFLMAMTSLSLVLAAFIKSVSTTVYMGFVIFIMGWIMQTTVIFGLPYTPSYYWTFGGIITLAFTLCPWDLLVKGFLDLGSAAVSSTSPGLRWSQRFSYCQNIPDESLQPPYNPTQVYMDFNCVMPLGLIYIICMVLWIGYFFVAVYLDNVVPNENGVSRGLFFFLMPSYWVARRTSSDSALATARRRDATLKVRPPPQSGVDEDVAAEELRVQQLLEFRLGKGDPPAQLPEEFAVEVYGLRKMFKQPLNSSGCCATCCGPCNCYTSNFWSVANSWFAIERNSLFCLLGPNGAGKTTTINCLTGVLPVTAGEMLVYNEPIAEGGGGLNRVRSMMGVCPQFDVLWGELTGREHMLIYGHIKGIHWQKVAEDADWLLERVQLTSAAGVRTASYSGGMRRRLSVAIALLGDPRVVYLDEPTTGMDPISRRHVWDIIQEAKVGRAIVLTTHSMEEADILGDRIAIMARGRVRCVGSSLRLKQKFGAGYRIAVSVTPPDLTSITADMLAERSRAVKAHFEAELHVVPSEEDKAYITFVIERSAEPYLAQFLRGLEERKASLGIVDVQLSLTTLEEVFLTIAKQAEMEFAAASGQSSQAFVLDDGSTLNIPQGAEWVMHPATRETYNVRWAQDESGALHILDAVRTAMPTAAPVMAPPHSQEFTPLAVNGTMSASVGSLPGQVPSLSVPAATVDGMSRKS